MASSNARSGNGEDKQTEHEHEEVDETLARHEKELEDLRSRVRTIQVELGAHIPNLAEGR